MNLLEQNILLNQFLEDHVYQIFEDSIHTVIPRKLKKSLESGICVADIVVGYSDTDQLKVDVFADKYANLDELCIYFNNIPGCRRKTYCGGKAVIYEFDTLELARYYYEELQREEYQTGMKR